MATSDSDPANGGSDWFDAQGPAPQADPFEQQLTDLYAKYGRGAPTAAEVAAHRGNPKGLAGVEETLKADNLKAIPSGGGRTDEAAIRAKIAQWAAMPGADPSLASNPDYWVNAINSRGGLGSDNEQYWQDASVGPTAFFNNPNRESGNRYGQAAGFGAPPAPYQSDSNAPTYEAPATPSWLSTPYVADTWKGGDFKVPDKPTALQTPFTAPTEADLLASPGYQSRLDTGLLAGNRSAAAQGTVLSGGTQKALNRYAQDYASNEYGNLFGQRVTQRGIADQEYGADVNNAFGAFGTNFNVFQTGVSNALAARQQNEGEFQANVVAPAQQSFANRYSSYLNENARTLSDYLTNYNIGHTADTDYWNRLKDVSGAGLDAAKNDRAA